MKTAFTAEQKVLQMAQDDLRLGIRVFPPLGTRVQSMWLFWQIPVSGEFLPLSLGEQLLKVEISNLIPLHLATI